MGQEVGRPDKKEDAMDNRLRELKAAVTGRGREIVVSQDGTVRSVQRRDNHEPEVPARRPRATKLAPRFFGSA